VREEARGCYVRFVTPSTLRHAAAVGGISLTVGTRQLGAAELRELFGTTAIPTPPTEKADPETVLAEIKRLDPEAIVRLADFE
jgi:hypothetical protein